MMIFNGTRIVSALILVGAVALSGLHSAARADDLSPLPAPVCALSAGALNCYAAGSAAPIPIAAREVGVIDFAVSVDGEWIVYRTGGGQVTVRAIYGTDTAQIDSDGLPPAVDDPYAATLAWSPDGLTIVYATPEGLRAAFPGTGQAPILVKVADRFYVNLRFSPDGTRLAAQDSNGRWVVYAIKMDDRGADGTSYALVPLGTYDRDSDAAWLDDNSLIVAPTTGGLVRLNVIDSSASLSAVWEKADGLFTRLHTTFEGQVYAIQLDPGDSIGPVMAIGGDGSLTALGKGKVDRRIGWVSNAKLMIYLTSGTPITVTPADGLEDALPIRSVTRIAWAAPFYVGATSLALDSDLYFLAANEKIDQNDVQLWQLPSDGLNQVTQLTRIPGGIKDFALSPDRKLAAVTTAAGNQLVMVPLPELVPPINATATPRGIRQTPTASASELPGVPGSRILDRITLAGGAQPDWSLDGRQIAYINGDGVYMIEAGLTSSTPFKLANFVSGKPFARPRFSPDRRFVLLQGPDANTFDALPLQTNTPRIKDTPFAATRALWGLNALFRVATQGDQYTLSAEDTDGSATLARSYFWPIRDVRPFGGSPGAAGQSVVFFRAVGWKIGPETLQLCAAAGDTGKFEARNSPLILKEAALSTSGKYAAGVSVGRDGTMRQLVILDLQNRRKVAIRGTREVSSLRWAR